MKKSILFSILLVAGGAFGCSSPSEGDPVPLEEEVEDAGGNDEDVLTLGDVNSSESDYRCDGAVITEWPLNDAVTTGAVTSTDEDGYREMVVSAGAGGMQESTQNPFIYVNLEAGERVDITDLDSLEDESWDLGFKRVVIRTNSGDSGPGGVELTKLAETTFEDVTEVPSSDTPYRTDRSFDDECEPVLDPIGNLYTAFNELNPFAPSGSQSWYNYDGGVSPEEGDIYVLRRGEDVHYKIEILAWESGEYTLRWASLE